MVSTSFAQKKPFWLSSIEESVEKDKLSPRIVNQQYIVGHKIFQYGLFLQINEGRAVIDIRSSFFPQNAKDDFEGSVELFSRKDSLKILPKLVIEIGDEGYMWTKPDLTTIILFRKKDIFVTVYTPKTEESLVDHKQLAKTLARHIEKYLP